MAINQDIYTAAEWVGQQIGVDPKIIYSQWSFEQGNAFKNPAAYNYNLAGLTLHGTPGIWRKYGSLEEFAKDYVNSFIKPNYPKAQGAKTVKEFVTGLKYGTVGSYYGGTSIEAYAAGVQANYNKYFSSKASSGGMVIKADTSTRLEKFKNRLATIVAKAKDKASGAASKVTGAASTVSDKVTDTTEAVTGVFDGSMLKQILLVTVGLVLVVFGGYLLFRPDGGGLAGMALNAVTSAKEG